MKSRTQTAAKISDLLRAALERAQQQNELFSIRSLAAHVKLSHSYLSKVIRGDRALSPHLLKSLIKPLQLDLHETAELQRLLLLQDGHEPQAKTSAEAITTDYVALGATGYWLLEDWYHLPLLNLATTVDFQPEPEWIAARLGITAEKVRRSLQRLTESGYLKQREDGSLERTQMRIRFPTQRSHPSVRAFHRSMIRKSVPLLELPPTDAEFARRLLSGIAFAADPSKVAEAKLILEDAMFKAAETLNSGENCTEVFQVNVQLFSLTK